MDYDFTRLSTRSFEQLTQALATAVIGPGIVVFGDGPDGGREATFDGKLSFPDPVAPWHGYGVVQAKFRQRPEGTGKDGEWALNELKKEIQKFTLSGRGLRKPEYYLFVTNVVLSPGAEKGGKDKLAKFLNSKKKALGLKDFRIWDYDQLRVLLDGQEGVRTNYSAWITPGDVLAAVLEQMQPRCQDFQAVMLNYVQKELLAEQYVRLGQAGHSEQDRMPLARVFVDLPIAKYRANDAERVFGEDSEPRRAVQSLLILGAQLLDPQSNEQKNKLAPASEPGRVVFIGGPGQGKSTVGQFLCQLHRVALLKLQKPLPDVQQACAMIEAQCGEEGLELPAVPRFPVRVELNAFAAELDKQTCSSLFDYILQRVRRRAERDLSADDLRAWMAKYPWLLVLDGLDEVPASSNRDAVLEAVSNFRIDAHQANADLLLLATSRPQGYDNDFSSQYFRHEELQALNVEQALHYAGRLLKQRFDADQDQIEKLTSRLKQASEEEATARLMRSPLQVTIMALLVENLGQPPKERWRLFRDYYDVISRREKGRDIPAAKLLNTYQADIDAIHQQTGLSLQLRAEQSGSTDALLSKDEFAQLVAHRLQQEGHVGCQEKRLQDGIMEAALDRLVFLVAPQAEKIGFEIRSIQEFMAAQALMNGGDEHVRARLRAIAPAAHWRNVFLFAAGRCFHDKQHLRDSLYTLCGELNEGEGLLDAGELERNILAGSRLALDLLEDGSMNSQPGQLNKYVRLALRLMELPPCQEHIRLAALYQSGLESVFKEEIEKQLAQALVEQQLGAWRVVLQLQAKGVGWVDALAQSCWPENNPEAVIAICRATDGVEVTDWLALKWSEAVIKLPPYKSDFGFQKDWQERFASRDCIPSWLNKIWMWTAQQIDKRLEINLAGIEGIAVRVRSCFAKSSETELVNEAGNVSPDWAWLINQFNFRFAPSKEKLAQIIAETENDNFPINMLNYSAASSWPVANCVHAEVDKDTLSKCRVSALSGALGDHQDWAKAEIRWRENGIALGDLNYIPSTHLPFDGSCAEIGFVDKLYGYSISNGSEEQIRSLVEIWREISHPTRKSQIASVLFFALNNIFIKVDEWREVFKNNIEKFHISIVSDAADKWVLLDYLRIWPTEYWQQAECLVVLDVLGQAAKFHIRSDVNQYAARVESLAACHQQNVSVWRIFSVCCATGYKPQRIELISNPDNFSDPKGKAAALLVQIAQARWQENDVPVLVEQAFTINESKPGLLDDLLRLIERQQMSGRAVECLLSELYSHLPCQEWTLRKTCMQAMQDRQRRRMSDGAVLMPSFVPSTRH